MKVRTYTEFVNEVKNPKKYKKPTSNIYESIEIDAMEFCKKSRHAQALAKELGAKFDIDNDDMNDTITQGAAQALYKLIEKE